jgi:type III pantothenate kinase
MLLAINIGNTNIIFGLFNQDKLEKKFIISIKNYRFKKLKKILSKINIDGCIICSVVPRFTKILAKDLRDLKIKEQVIVGKDIRVPIKNLYRQPERLGQDRLVNAYAGLSFYGTACVIIDTGTAITFDIVSKNKAYLGGMILPGLNMCLDALAKNTALLPKVKLKKPKEFIGKDTENSILSGLAYGFASLVDGIVEKIKKSLGYPIKVIGTGGDISFIYKYCYSIDRIDKDLTLKGLSLLFKNYRKK